MTRLLSCNAVTGTDKVLHKNLSEVQPRQLTPTHLTLFKKHPANCSGRNSLELTLTLNFNSICYVYNINVKENFHEFIFYFFCQKYQPVEMMCFSEEQEHETIFFHSISIP